jgi:hypothetical protein
MTIMEAVFKVVAERANGKPDGHDASAIRASLAALKDVLGQENALLEAGGTLQLQPFITQKNQLLKDLMMLQRQHVEGTPPDWLRDEMKNVRQLLTQNARLLGLQLAALKDISQALTKVIAQEDSDGTYARAQA